MNKPTLNQLLADMLYLKKVTMSKVTYRRGSHGVIHLTHGKRAKETCSEELNRYEWKFNEFVSALNASSAVKVKRLTTPRKPAIGYDGWAS